MAVSSDSILRKQTRTKFATIDNEVLQDTRLSFRATGVAAFLLSQPDDWKINLGHLIRGKGREGRDAVRASLQELARFGYLMRTREAGGYGKARTITTIADYPAFADVGTETSRINGYEALGIRPTDFQDVDFRPTENTSVDFSECRKPVGHTNDYLQIGGVEVGGDLSVTVSVSESLPSTPTTPPAQPSENPAPVDSPASEDRPWVAPASLTAVQATAAELFRGCGLKAANQLAARCIVTADDLVWAGLMVTEYQRDGLDRPALLHGRITRHEQPVEEAKRAMAAYAWTGQQGAAEDTPVALPEGDAMVDPAWAIACAELAHTLPAWIGDDGMLGRMRVDRIDGDPVVYRLHAGAWAEWMQRAARQIRAALKAAAGVPVTVEIVGGAA